MSLQRKTREVGIISMVEDLAGEEARTRPTSSDVTGERISSTEPRWEGIDKSLGNIHSTMKIIDTEVLGR